MDVNWAYDGFSRKDYWQKHMKDEHEMAQKAVKDLQKNGVPMVVKKDGEWVVIMPKIQVQRT